MTDNHAQPAKSDQVDGVPSVLFDMVRDFLRLIVGICRSGWDFLEDWLLNGKKAQYGVAVSRILLGVGSAGLLLTNFSTRLYTFGAGAAWTDEFSSPTSDFPQIWLFSAFRANFENDFAITLLCTVTLVLCILFALGWRTRIILPLLLVFWLSFIYSNGLVNDQGDNAFRIFLISFFFIDSSQRWSLDSLRRRRFANSDGNVWRRLWRSQPVLPAWWGSLTQNLAIVAITCQISFIYVSGALYKAGGTPWQDGYAIYNPIHVVRFGPWPELSALLTAWAPAVAFMTYTALLGQLLFPALLMRRPTRIVGLFVIVTLHLMIAILMGLPWFSLFMIAIDFIFIRDQTWRHAAEYVTRQRKRILAAWASSRSVKAGSTQEANSPFLQHSGREAVDGSIGHTSSPEPRSSHA